ncbi:chromosome segregation protein SMC [Anoxybacillus sp. B7M1]|jgi:chromosome segregation protein|uniref:chromosome segregation protein SMC n=1 Tax=unclassified Anoxybacillus TaxID=2639704 RepID=UPI0005CD5B25|nr:MULTISPECIES: chromosome segregation protein SMC [unclassified Anoxybacillus]ANB57227.1 chromosome segregation protein SMC [Anoxybacillus sp. B2M1]ANB65375.1 chromosome segregation protein SMC [Anoxybacillus sp. B7M1]
MFLKRLDIVGFKSFADRVSIEFVPGVTAVVGPNGSGKSNITDAIRWVLGEQSAKSLRGAKMEDIIFAGSDSRRPLNIAEVTLTLDNEDGFLPLDYQEVSVTRRVYRSGESEFLINQQPCRLKDIIDLFMDSGLGKEAFSIIGQGRIEEILSSKPEERRTIFEEAAGVLKYKIRKKKAEHKLNETQENLHRVNDILHELESQLEPLKIQASIAQDYLEKRNELETFEVALIAHEIEELHRQWNHLRDQLTDHQQKEMALSAALQKEEATVEQLRDQMTALDESIDGLQQVLLVVSEELEKLEGRKEVLKERKKNAAQYQKQLEETISSLSEKSGKLCSTLEKEREQLTRIREELHALQTELKEKQRAFASYDISVEEQMERLKSDYIELVHEQASLKNERTHLQALLEKLEKKQSVLTKENEKHLAERNRIKEQYIALESKCQQTERKLKEQETQLQQKSAQLAELKQEIEQKESMLYQAYQYLQQTKSRKEMLEEMQHDYAGFFQGVKEILKAREQLLGIHGAVVELIHVSSKYETAIEIALGGAMQHIVVADEEAARAAIHYLKKHSYGRATFLPMNVLQPKQLPSEQLAIVKNHPAFVGVANELVSYDSIYQTVLAHLLGHVIVTTNLKGANELARLLHYRYRLVTLEGDVVSPGGAMTGGGVAKKTNSLLSRNRELETITDKLRDMEAKTEQLELFVQSKKKEAAQREAEMAELRKQIEERRFALQEIKSAWREVEWQEKNTSERLALYDEEKAHDEQEMRQLREKITTVEQKLYQMEAKLAEIDEQMQHLTLQKQDEQSSKEALQAAITEQKVAVAEKQQLLKHIQEKIAQLTLEQEETEKQLQAAKEDLLTLTDEMNSNVSGEEQLDQLRQQKVQDKQETLELIASRREQRLQYQEMLENSERELKEKKRQYKQLTEIIKDEEVKLNRLDVELENLLSRLREEYMLTFEAAKEKYPLQMEAEAARKKVKLIKRAIDELGTVNLGAIDEYDRVSERYQFLTEQKSDLQHAKETLHQVIDEMDQEMKKRFLTTFQQIRSHFGDVFQQLFGGGRADLQLTDSNDLLNTGVEIVAQPPGKKLQNLSLLSGGERALTAIALLFSILKVRPVPFCVLDEVEAALDEANVHRYALYLKRFSSQTQFIVITHRKGTMEEADVLYGVTMQESGVSRLVSVRLEDSKQLVKS